MKILFVEMKGSIKDLRYELEAMGHEVVVTESFFFDNFGDNTRSIKLLKKIISKNCFDCVITYMFSPSVSYVCQESNLKYISWIYDSPAPELYSKEAENEVNRIFIFDKKQLDHAKRDTKLNNIFHLPLGTSMIRNNSIHISKDDEKKFSTEVSFVGNLYDGNQYDLFRNVFGEEEQKLMQKYLEKYFCNWNEIRQWPLVSEKCLDVFEESDYFDKARTYGMNRREYLGVAIMARKMAQLERITILGELSKYCNVTLFTGSQNRKIENVDVRGTVSYSEDMVKVFNLSKVNLNIAIPSIETGVPLRVWDIMGAGGFCVTNYQVELEDYFKEGVELEWYKSFDELKDKTLFYLRNEDARIKVLLNGYKKVTEMHTYPHRIRAMFEHIEKS